MTNTNTDAPFPALRTTFGLSSTLLENFEASERALKAVERRSRMLRENLPHCSRLRNTFSLGDDHALLELISAGQRVLDAAFEASSFDRPKVRPV